jgi:bacteriocin-like protein
MKATHFMALALALTLIGVPTFALSADLSTPPESFKALSKVTSTDETSPTPLTEQELAQVEGGWHVETARAFFAIAFLHALAGDFYRAINSALAGTLIGFMSDHSHAY